MAKHTDPLIEALLAGRSFTWTMPDGGNFASMRAAFRHGQTLTMSPVVDPAQIQVGDIVCLRWHAGYIVHLVQEIQEKRFLIVNSVGKINGWVEASAIIGRVTQTVEPEPRPDVPELLERLNELYCRQIERCHPGESDARRLLAVVDDLAWYADRIGAALWDELPRANRWSFHQNLWHLVRQNSDEAGGAPLERAIDRGKRVVGQAAESLALFAGSEDD